MPMHAPHTSYARNAGHVHTAPSTHSHAHHHTCITCAPHSAPRTAPGLPPACPSPGALFSLPGHWALGRTARRLVKCVSQRPLQLVKTVSRALDQREKATGEPSARQAHGAAARSSSVPLLPAAAWRPRGQRTGWAAWASGPPVRLLLRHPAAQPRAEGLAASPGLRPPGPHSVP